MRNKLTFKKRNFWNTGLFTLLQALAVWIAFIALMLLWLSKVGDVEAAEIEIIAGQSTYQKSDNGIFYQNGFENEFQLKSSSIGIGFTDYLTESIRYHAGYMNLGNVSSYAKALPTDANYNPGTSGCNGECLPLAQWHGSGKVEGLYYTVAPELILGKWKVFIEGGVWAYQATHSVIIPDTISCAGCTPRTYHFIHKKTIDFGFVYGVGVEYDKTQLTINFWQSNVNGVDPNTDIGFYQGYTMNISLRQRF